MNIANPRTEDWVLMFFMTGGMLVPYFIGVFIYIGIRSFGRRYIKRLPDWSNF